MWAVLNFDTDLKKIFMWAILNSSTKLTKTSHWDCYKIKIIYKKNYFLIAFPFGRKKTNVHKQVNFTIGSVGLVSN